MNTTPLTISLPVPAEQEISALSTNRQRAEALTIASDADFASTAEFVKAMAALRTKVDDERTSITRPLDEAKRQVMARYRPLLDDIDGAVGTAKKKMLDYQTALEAARRERQRQLDEAARKERERLERQAANAAAKGKDEKAAQLEQRAAMAVAPVIQAEQPKAAGISTREVWKHAIEDPLAVPREYTVPDDKKIGAVVRATKGQLKIPGVRIWSERIIAARS